MRLTILTKGAGTMLEAKIINRAEGLRSRARESLSSMSWIICKRAGSPWKSPRSSA